MSPEFLIFMLLCRGQDCDLLQVEPAFSYVSEQECNAAAAAKAASLTDTVELQAYGSVARILCVRELRTIAEVEELHVVIANAIVHVEPNDGSSFVAILDKGARVLVTGHVDGSQWDRVLMSDGSSGFVYADRLRKIGGSRAVAATQAEPTQHAVQVVPPP